jgi:hypothetical protein
LDLLEETKELESTTSPNAGRPALDVNLISSLTRWAIVAKERVDGQRLDQILELYSHLGHLTPDLRSLLTQIIALVDGSPEKQAPPAGVPEIEAPVNGASSQNIKRNDADAQECIDLIFHLHGVLAGSLAFSV